MTSRSARVLVTGCQGQLGTALLAASKTKRWQHLEMTGVDRAAVDICNRDAFTEKVVAFRPDVVVNAAAFTNVDGAEKQAEIAENVNGLAVEGIAETCSRENVRLVQISTDYVFDGQARRPIPVDAPVNPVSAYGRSKLLGETACLERLGEHGLVVRTSWVYAARHGNFVATMLRLMADREEVRVVADQVGTPTWARTLSEGVLRLLEGESSGIQHVADSGVTTWFDFAVAIEQLAFEKGLLSRRCLVTPITTAEYPTPAIRPMYSVLDQAMTWQELEWCSPDWRQSLSLCLDQWADGDSGSHEENENALDKGDLT